MDYNFRNTRSFRQETGLCKNLLQEYAQKMNYAIPSYICTKPASGLAPFICTVEIGGIQYIGAAARTKKDAEIKAARTALLAIQGQSEGSANGATKHIVVPGKKVGKEVEKRPIETPKPLKAKKGGFKKKWNKRKFMKKDGQAVDVEKDEARVAGDAHDSDVLMQPTVITQEASCGTLFLQPCEEAKRVEDEPPRDIEMVQPDKENQHSDAALVQPDDEARVEQEPSRDISVVQPNEEAISAKQEPSIDAATLQPKEEAMKTGCVALVLCLNISVDPPDVIKISPYARKECWIDPFSMAPPKALETIGKTLHSQYERWQPKARYKLQLDPTLEEVKKLCNTCRKFATRTERVLFNYNGHGVPKPTANGEIWVFNKVNVAKTLHKLLHCLSMCVFDEVPFFYFLV
uniref:DRBM domain-containing protein n=1 Tax=Oryza glumipatula TaxID=40148 RepID=A0A0E0AKZ0_9ORYZ